MSTPETNAEPKVLAFDVFGTVVDWCGSVAREVTALRPELNGPAFARDWRMGYQPALRRVAASGRWQILDELHREILDEVASAYDLNFDDSELQHLNEAWHRLRPWPDSAAGIARLSQKFIVTPLSNGDVRMLTMMAKNGGLHWDAVLSAELVRAYKPDRAAYLLPAKVFRVRPEEVLMVATHFDDLDGAKAAGLQTAYIERPLEYGEEVAKDSAPRAAHPLHVSDIGALADHFGL